MTIVKKDDAVSPVIGVILMVAITVILAAVIAAFVFGMAGNVQKTKNIAATATQQGLTTTITYVGGPDSGDLATDGLSYAVTSTNGTIIKSSTAFATPINVGSSVMEPHSPAGTKDHVVVTAKFADGTSQVILDTYV